MARLKDLSVGCKDAFLFDPETIEERPGYNARDMESPETRAHIRKMADAIKAGGTATFPPITIGQEDGKIFVYSGYCRRRAFVIAKKEGAPVKGILAIANTQKEDERVLDLLNSNDGLPLTLIEQAKVVGRLVAFDWTPTEIARRRGVSEQAIYNLLDLLDAPTEVKELVKTGKVSATLAVNTVRKEGKAKGAETLKRAVKTAEAQGKSKATAKFVTPAGINKKVNIAKLKETIGDLSREDFTEIHGYVVMTYQARK